MKSFGVRVAFAVVLAVALGVFAVHMKSSIFRLIGLRPGTEDSVNVMAVIPILLLIGGALGWWRKDSWIFLAPAAILVVGDAHRYFSPSFAGTLTRAQPRYVALWIASFALGLTCSLVARARLRRRTDSAGTA